MREFFYIVNKDNWYRLHIKYNHYCLGGCSSPEPLLRTITKLIKKYRTKEKLISAIQKKEGKKKINEKMVQVYENEFELYGKDYEGIVSELVNKILEEVKNDTPFKRAQKRLALVKVNHNITKAEEHNNITKREESNNITKETRNNEGKKLKRPVLLRRNKLITR